MSTMNESAAGLPEPAFPERPNCSPTERGRATASATGRRPRSLTLCAAGPFPTSSRGSFPENSTRSSPISFTEFKCNLDCHYCWSYDNRVKGMTEDVASESIDWLHGTTCRVLALMGGEVLLRPQFVHKVVYYAAKRGFWIYVPTNGRLLKPNVIDRLADAGVATFNLAVDAVDEKPGLPKALNPIRSYFEYLVTEAVPVRLHRLPQHQHLPSQPRRCARADRDRARAHDLDRLPHQRAAAARAEGLQASRRQPHLHPARGSRAGRRRRSTG